MARFEVLKSEKEAPKRIFQRLIEGEKLGAIARIEGCPPGLFKHWFSTTHGDLLDAAAKVWALDQAFEALDAAKSVPQQAVDPQGKGLFDDAGKPILVERDVARDRLYVETLLKLASKFDRQRFGETVRVEKSVHFTADAGLLGTAGELLRRVREKVIDGDALTGVTLPPSELPERIPVLVDMGPI